jgi:cytochrome c553
MAGLILGSACLTAASAPLDEAAIAAFKSLDSMEARVQGCVTCHGQQGQGTGNAYFPRLAGKPALYLYNQLVAFRDGTRKYPPMNYLVAYLPDAYLREMAEHFANERPAFAAPVAQAVVPSVLTRGQKLVASGDAAGQIPACVACHGAALTGMEPGVPGLVGLRSSYITAQLTRWRSGDRRAADPDCMQRIAARLSDADVTAVASWLASLPAPRELAPESSNYVRMPLACGSQQRPVP